MNAHFPTQNGAAGADGRQKAPQALGLNLTDQRMCGDGFTRKRQVFSEIENYLAIGVTKKCTTPRRIGFTWTGFFTVA